MIPLRLWLKHPGGLDSLTSEHLGFNDSNKSCLSNKFCLSPKTVFPLAFVACLVLNTTYFSQGFGQRLWLSRPHLAGTAI